MKSSKDRGQTNIIAVIVLTLSVVVIFGIYTLNLEIDMPKKSLFIQITIDKITKDTGKSKKFEDQIIIIRHLGGDSINVKNMILVVTVYRDNKPIKKCTLSEFPWKVCIGCTIPKSSIKGDQIIDRSPNHYSYALGEISDKADGIWSSGETIGFRIKKYNRTSNEGLNLQNGDVVEVKIVYDGFVVSEASKRFYTN